MHFTDARAFDLAEKMIDIFHDQFDFRFLGNRVIPIHLQTGAALASIDQAGWYRLAGDNGAHVPDLIDARGPPLLKMMFAVKQGEVHHNRSDKTHYGEFQDLGGVGVGVIQNAPRQTVAAVKLPCSKLFFAIAAMPVVTPNTPANIVTIGRNDREMDGADRRFVGHERRILCER